MSLVEYAERIVSAALPQRRQPYGGWHGSMRSKAAMLVPPDYMAESDADTPSSNFLYVPRSGTWKRRGGTTQQFDTFGSAVGMLPAKWSSKCRDLQEFVSESFTDGYPTVAALLTKETIASGLDDGRFSTLWVRDQVASVNYTLGDEFSSSSYPTPGTTQLYKYVPLWYDSGDGGVSRGVTEFQRRLLLNGSRKMAKVGNWWYFPSVLGTPSRWRGTFTAAAALINYARPEATSNGANWAGSDGTPAGNDISHLIDETTADSSDYARIPDNFNSSLDILLTTITDPGVNTGHTINVMVAKTAQVNPPTDKFTITLRVGTTAIASYDTASSLSSTPTTFSYTLSGAEAATIRTTGVGYADLRIRVDYSSGTSAGNNDFRCYHAAFQVGTTSATASRLIPSGPLPPCHAGTLAKGNAIAGSAGQTVIYPDADISTGAWTNEASGTPLYSSIDDVSSAPNLSDFIKVIGANSTAEVSFQNFGFAPNSADTINVTIRYSGFLPSTLTVDVVEVATVRATQVITLTDPLTPVLYNTFSVAPSLVTNWDDVRLRFTTTNCSGVDFVVVYMAYITHVASGQSNQGGWHGADRFYYSVAYRFEDDSVWMPCIPRAPNTTLTAGFNLFTVDSGNSATAYDKVTWSNIPIGPYGVKSRLLLRTPKIDSTTTDNLALDPYDLRLTWEIQDNTTTTYDDYFADDDALVLDVDELVVRFDHRMPPRARYIFAGDSRVCHSYGGENPCAIILAPVSMASDTAYDRNSPDTTAALYNQNSSYFQLSATTLTLVEDTGSGTTTTTFTLSTYDTLEKLVDAINATSVAINGRLWRAQIAPKANPQALTATHLTPTVRAITSCVVSGQSITKAAGGLSAIPVGAFISEATAGAYISAIVSDTQLTYVGTGASSGTLTFVSGTGDAITGATHTSYEGYQRVIANSLPGFIYFNNTYLDQFPLDKNAVWMTVASPGAVKSAANCFSGEIANKHTPPHDIGISMGGAGIDNGFLVPYSKGIGAIRNTRDAGTGFDFDYRFFFIEPSEGCCSWASIAAGNRVGVYAKPSGIYAADLFNEKLLSDATWQQPGSDANVGTGDFTVEMPLSIGSTGADTDNAYLAAKILRNALWLTFRKSSTTHPDRQVVYDFSSDSDQSGLKAMFKPDGRPYGWSVPLVRSMSMMTEGRRGGTAVGTAGVHLYGWNEANAGSTGDGRIDEFEIAETDNGTAISGSITTPWFSPGSNQLSAQELTVWHSSTTGVTAAIDFHRSYSDETYSLTPSTSATLPVVRDIKMLTLPARVTTAACYIGWRQSAGTAAELRAIELRYKSLPSYK